MSSEKTVFVHRGTTVILEESSGVADLRMEIELPHGRHSLSFLVLQDMNRKDVNNLCTEFDSAAESLLGAMEEPKTVRNLNQVLHQAAREQKSVVLSRDEAQALAQLIRAAIDAKVYVASIIEMAQRRNGGATRTSDAGGPVVEDVHRTLSNCLAVVIGMPP